MLLTWGYNSPAVLKYVDSYTKLNNHFTSQELLKYQ